MPRRKRASGKRRRASSPGKCADPVFEIVKRMHLPQVEAAGLLDALVLMGHGMRELGRDDADAVLTLAEAARERLRLIDDGCLDLVQVAHGALRSAKSLPRLNE
jgi:microcystin degradation protein MlrC